MTSRVGFPFLRLSDETVDASPWLIARSLGEYREAGEFLADWDYMTSVRMSRTVSVDLEGAGQQLELDWSTMTLSVRVRIGTGPGRFPRSIIFRHALELSEAKPEATFDFRLIGSILSSQIYAETVVLLVDPGSRTGDLSPKQSGDRLWQDQFRVRLEGEEPRFPIEVADFRHLLGEAASASPWYLHWSPLDWQRDFHGAVRLYLNSRHKELIAKIEAEDPDTLRFLMADVMGQICECLLRDPDAESILENCDPGSLGSQARSWLQLGFSNSDFDQIKGILSGRPGLFRASIQALAEQKQVEA